MSWDEEHIFFDVLGHKHNIGHHDIVRPLLLLVVRPNERIPSRLLYSSKVVVVMDGRDYTVMKNRLTGFEGKTNNLSEIFQNYDDAMQLRETGQILVSERVNLDVNTLLDNFRNLYAFRRYYLLT